MLLIKLSRLNNTVLKLNRIDEKFRSHSGTEKRIKRIIETITGNACFDMEEVN